MRSTGRAILLATLGVAVAAPAAVRAGDWKCAARGGREWREVSSEHFRIVTDLSSGRAGDLAEELETMHAAVRTGLFANPPPMPGLIRVIAFRDEEDYREFAEEKVDAYYVPEIAGLPTVVMHGNFGEYTRIVVAHELSHHVLASVFPRQPRWFSEGYACYLETVGASGPGNWPVVGGVPKHRITRLHASPERLAALLQVKGSLPDVDAYGLAWALVFFLVQTHGGELDQFQARLARGEDPDAAWLAVFPRWDPRAPAAMTALEREIRGYLAKGPYRYSALQLEKDHPHTERPFASADVHGLRIFLPRPGGPKVEELRARQLADADEALAEDPGQVEALRLTASLRGGDASPLSERAVTVHPGSVWAWIFRGATAKEPAERERAYRRAVELAPENPAALSELAGFLVEAEREGEALPFARKAAGLAPWRAPTLDTYSAALQGLGRCPDALLLARRAVDVLPEHLDAERRRPYLERLAALERSCGAAKSP